MRWMQGLSLSPGDYEREVGKDPTLEARRDAGVRRRAIVARPAPASVTTQQRRLTAPYPRNASGAPWDVYAIAAPSFTPTTPSPRSPSRCLLLDTPPRHRWPRASPASLPRSCAFWTTTLERQHPYLPRFPAPGQRPPSPPSPFSSFLLLSLDLLDLPRPSDPSPVHHQPPFLFGPRPRSRTAMVRGRGRGPNRRADPSPVSDNGSCSPDRRSGSSRG